MPRDTINEENELLRDFVAPGSSATAAPYSAPMTPDQLMATPAHMLAWLRAKDPSEIVTNSIHHPRKCLGCSFMAAHGFSDVTFGGSFFRRAYEREWDVPKWFKFTGNGALGHLVFSGHEYGVTAAQAIAAIERTGAA